MATGPRYKTAFRRRRQGKTDYHARRRMVISAHHRLVIRISSTRIITQIMEALPEGDRTIAFAESRQLKEFGWRASIKNLPTAYLTGYLIGKRALKAGTSTAITDIGLALPIPGSRIFAAIKGAIDAGLKVPCAEKMFPKEKRIRGEHIAAYAKDLNEDAPTEFKRQFGRVSKGRVDLTKLPTMFDTTKSNIEKKFPSRGSA
jgi:large subunit ribosomal protein L18